MDSHAYDRVVSKCYATAFEIDAKRIREAIVCIDSALLLAPSSGVLPTKVQQIIRDRRLLSALLDLRKLVDSL